MLQYARDGIWAFVDRRAAARCAARSTGPTRRRCRRAPRPPHGEVVLDVRAVRKEFGGLVAVNDVSFQVRAGEILGLIGPNGAGKSTTFNLVTGVLPATRGEVALARRAHRRAAVARDRAARRRPHLPARAR